MSSRRRVAAALLTCDIVDSTALVTTLGDERAARLFERFDRVSRDLLVEHEGREIDRTDGFLHLFERTADAVRYAEALHLAMQQLSRELEVELTVRVGIHFGEMLLRDNRPEDVERGAKPVEVEGLVKPVAARVMALALGGQTLISDPSVHMARRALQDDGTTDWRWTSHGAYALKGLDERLTIWEVGAAGRMPDRAPAGALGSGASRGRALSSLAAVLGIVGLGLAAWWITTRESGPAFGKAPIAFEDPAAQLLFEQAFEAWDEAEGARAMTLWRQADALDPSSPTHWLLGQLISLDQRGLGVDAQLVTEDLPRRAEHVDHPHAKASLAYVTMFERGLYANPDAATEFMRDNLPPSPDDYLIEALRARASVSPLSAEAAAALSRRLPRSASTRIARAATLRGEPERQLEEYELARQLNPASPLAQLRYVTTLRELGRLDAMRAALPEALAAAPLSRVRFLAAELALREGDRETFEHHRTVLMARGRSVEARGNDGRDLAWLLADSGMPDAATQQVEATVELVRQERDSTQETWALLVGGELGWQLHDVEMLRRYSAKAKDLLARADLTDLVRAQIPINLLMNRLRIALLAGDEPATRQALAEIAELDESRKAVVPIALFKLEGAVHEMVLGGRTDDARKAWSSVLGDCSGAMFLGRSLVRMRRFEEAAEQAEFVLERDDCVSISPLAQAEALTVLARAAQARGESALSHELAAQALDTLPLAEPGLFLHEWCREILDASRG